MCRSGIYFGDVNYRLIFISATALGASFLLSSCNTMLGMGRDFQRLGQGLENKAYGKKW